MGRKSDIRAEISSLEGKINEYNRCINDLKGVESSLKLLLTDFDSDVYTKTKEYNVTYTDFWRGNNANIAMNEKEESQDLFYKLALDDGDALTSDIMTAIRIYESKINDCRNRISSLNSELERILESERRAARQVL